MATDPTDPTKPVRRRKAPAADPVLTLQDFLALAEQYQVQSLTAGSFSVSFPLKAQGQGASSGGYITAAPNVGVTDSTDPYRSPLLFRNGQPPSFSKPE